MKQKVIMTMVFCAILGSMACSSIEDDLSHAYPLVDTKAVEKSETNPLYHIFSAEVINLDKNVEIIEHGFTWSKTKTFDTVKSPHHTFEGSPANATFSFELTSPLTAGRHYVRGYIKTDDKTIYGTISSFLH